MAAMRWRPSSLLVAAVTALVLLAGCGHRAPPPDGEPSALDFDGDAAFALLREVVHLPDGTLRPRTPGQQEATAQWLAEAMAAPGWQVSLQAFNGSTYLAHPPGAVASYQQGCPPADRAALAGFTFWNVVAEYGPADAGRRLLLGAHWDAKEDAEGGGVVPAANDGASGVALLLQLVRQVGGLRPELPFALTVVLFDGEDGFEDCHPLAGSLHYARTMPADARGGGRVDRMLLLDMVGDPNARFVREQRSVAADPAFVDLLWQHGRARLGAEVFTDQSKPVLDDHVPFIEEGVAAVDLIDFGRPAGEGRFGFPPYWHTPDDTLDNLSPAMLDAVGDVVWATVTDPAFLESWP